MQDCRKRYILDFLILKITVKSMLLHCFQAPTNNLHPERVLMQIASPAVTRSRARRLQLAASSGSTGGAHLNAEDGVTTQEVPTEKVCKVCYIVEKNTAIVPCGHQFCKICAERVKEEKGECPMCKQKIVFLLTLYD